MIITINENTMLSTGNVATNCVVELYDEAVKPGESQIIAYLKVWASQADKDAGRDITFLAQFDNPSVQKVPNLAYPIPQADLDQCLASGNYGVIGTNYPQYVLAALEQITGCDKANMVINSLI